MNAHTFFRSPIPVNRWASDRGIRTLDAVCAFLRSQLQDRGVKPEHIAPVIDTIVTTAGHEAVARAAAHLRSLGHHDQADIIERKDKQK